MNNEEQFLQKLMISKKIMEKHNTISRGNAQPINSPNTPMVEEYQPISGNYNIPKEFLSEQQTPTTSYSSEIPTKDRILNSKLPDEIKQLMIEHPIEKPNVVSNNVISNELVEKATRLMNTKANGETINERKNNTVNYEKPVQSVNNDEIRSIVRETVQEVLRENGLIVESETKSNEVFKFRVGKHIFEGKLTNIKKISK